MVPTFWGRNEEENEDQEQWNGNCIGFNLNLTKSFDIMKKNIMPNTFIFIVQSCGYFSRVRNQKAILGVSWYNS